MPSVEDLLDRLTSEAKLNGTASSSDRVLALSWLQEGCDRAFAEAGLPITSEASVTLTAGDPTYTLDASPFPTDMVALLDVVVTDAALTASPVNYITPHEMQARRIGGAGQAAGTPYEYSGDWPNFVIWPPPAASGTTTLTITYLASAPTLVDNTTALGVIPPGFWWSCVYEFAFGRALEFKQQDSKAERRFSSWEKNLRAFKRWAGSSMARQGPVRPRIYSPVYSTSQDLGAF